MDFVEETVEFYYNPEELGLFQSTWMEKVKLEQSRGHVEAVLAMEEMREDQEAREGMPF